MPSSCGGGDEDDDQKTCTFIRLNTFELEAFILFDRFGALTFMQ